MSVARPPTGARAENASEACVSPRFSTAICFSCGSICQRCPVGEPWFGRLREGGSFRCRRYTCRHRSSERSFVPDEPPRLVPPNWPAQPRAAGGSCIDAGSGFASHDHVAMLWRRPDVYGTRAAHRRGRGAVTRHWFIHLKSQALDYDSQAWFRQSGAPEDSAQEVSTRQRIAELMG